MEVVQPCESSEMNAEMNVSMSSCTTSTLTSNSISQVESTQSPIDGMKLINNGVIDNDMCRIFSNYSSLKYNCGRDLVTVIYDSNMTGLDNDLFERTIEDNEMMYIFCVDDQDNMFGVFTYETIFKEGSELDDDIFLFTFNKYGKKPNEQVSEKDLVGFYSFSKTRRFEQFNVTVSIMDTHKKLFNVTGAFTIFKKGCRSYCNKYIHTLFKCHMNELNGTSYPTCFEVKRVIVIKCN